MPPLLSASQYRAIVSGQARGTRPALVRGALGLAAFPYAWGMGLRNLAFDRGWRRSHAVPVPVISVGNLTLGGTGKTPMVEWIARWLGEQGVRVVLISRGYGSPRNGSSRSPASERRRASESPSGPGNDEALELAEKLPGVPHLQHPDRVASARRAVQELRAQAILLDDGFQHRRLRRDLDIVLLDALDPWGGGRVFPRGLLREPVGGLRRAHVVCLSRADLIEPAERQAIRARVAELAPKADWVEAAHAPLALRTARGDETPCQSLAGRRVAAFCGIGNPPAFRWTLESLGCEIAAFREFPDHHAYGPADIDALAAWAAEHGAEAVVCTHKDLVKIGLEQLGKVPLWAVRIGLRVDVGRELLEARLGCLGLRVAGAKRSAAPAELPRDATSAPGPGPRVAS